MMLVMIVCVVLPRTLSLNIDHVTKDYIDDTEEESIPETDDVNHFIVSCQQIVRNRISMSHNIMFSSQTGTSVSVCINENGEEKLVNLGPRYDFLLIQGLGSERLLQDDAG